jgi:hypothetical protein
MVTALHEHRLTLTCSALRLRLLALAVRVTLRYVTIPSSANCFTTTMALSAGSLCIDLALLPCLGLKASARGTDPHKQLFSPGKINNVFVAYLASLPQQIYVKDIGFGGPRHLPLC